MKMLTCTGLPHGGVRASAENLESRKLLAATPVPIPNFVGDYVGSFQTTTGDTQSITISITTQKKRSFSGSFVEGDGSMAVLKGAVPKKGSAKITFRSTNANPKFNGTALISLNSTGDTLAGLLFIHTGKVNTKASVFGIKQV
jgi:hypothetical protein